MTKSEPANTKPTAASAAYAQRSADIARLIDTLRQELASHAKRAALAEKHWGYAGDLGSVREGLLDLVTAMSGIEREDVEEMLAEGHAPEAQTPSPQPIRAVCPACDRQLTVHPITTT